MTYYEIKQTTPLSPFAITKQVQDQLEAALGTQESQKKVLEALNNQLAEKIDELAGIHRELNTVLQN